MFSVGLQNERRYLKQQLLKTLNSGRASLFVFVLYYFISISYLVPLNSPFRATLAWKQKRLEGGQAEDGDLNDLATWTTEAEEGGY